MIHLFLSTIFSSLFFIGMTGTVMGEEVYLSTMTGSQEITARATGVPTGSSCTGILRIPDNESEIRYKVQCFNIDGLTEGHIHIGTAGSSGPIISFIFGDPSITPLSRFVVAQDFKEIFEISGTIVEGDEKLENSDFFLLLEEIRSGETYFNFHTKQNRTGEVRGQIVRVQDTKLSDNFFVSSASGDQQVPEDVDTDATCWASFLQINDAEGLKFKLKCWNIEGVTQAHIHLADARNNGPVVAVLFPPGEATGPVNGVIKRDNGDKSKGRLVAEDVMEGMTLAELVQAMRQDNTYVNVYTEANPGGETRGHIAFTNTFAGF